MSAAAQVSHMDGVDAIAEITAMTLGKAPEMLPTIGAHNAQVWRSSLVSPSVLEAMRLRNARTVHCVTCKAVRYDVARADGFGESKAQMVTDAYRGSALSAQEKAAIALADCYLGFPAGMTAEAVKEISSAFSPEEIRSMLLAVMTFNYASRAAVSFGGMPEEDLPITEMQI